MTSSANLAFEKTRKLLPSGDHVIMSSKPASPASSRMRWSCRRLNHRESKLLEDNKRDDAFTRTERNRRKVPSHHVRGVRQTYLVWKLLFVGLNIIQSCFVIIFDVWHGWNISRHDFNGIQKSNKKWRCVCCSERVLFYELLQNFRRLFG